MDRSDLGPGQRSQLYLCAVVKAEEHEGDKYWYLYPLEGEAGKKIQSPPVEGRCRRSIVCRRLLLQQLARAKAALKSGQRTTVKPELHVL